MKTLLTISLRRQRDLLVARLRLRQICKLLGFSLPNQVRAACTAFELACRETQKHGRLTLTINLEEKLLCVYLSRPSAMDCVCPLPVAQVAFLLPENADLAREDVVWTMQQLLNMDRPDLFAEVRQHNQDLLYAMAQLQQAAVTQPPVPGVPCAA